MRAERQSNPVEHDRPQVVHLSASPFQWRCEDVVGVRAKVWGVAVRVANGPQITVAKISI